MNLLRRLTGALLPISFALAIPTVCAAETLHCPATLKVQELASSPASEWSVRIGEALRPLVGVSFHHGSPDDANRLQPGPSTGSGKDRISTWRFGSKAGTIWIACRYRETGITLARRLPLAYQRCSVRMAAGSIVKAIDCR
jgi:hypothetical protein